MIYPSGYTVMLWRLDRRTLPGLNTRPMMKIPEKGNRSAKDSEVGRKAKSGRREGAGYKERVIGAVTNGGKGCRDRPRALEDLPGVSDRNCFARPPTFDWNRADIEIEMEIVSAK